MEIWPEVLVTKTKSVTGPQDISVSTKILDDAMAAAARLAGVFLGYANANRDSGVVCRSAIVDAIDAGSVSLKAALREFGVFLTIRDELQEAPPLLGVYVDGNPRSSVRAEREGAYRFFGTFAEAARFLGVSPVTLGNHRDRLLRERKENGDCRCHCLVKHRFVKFMEEAFEKGSLGSRPRKGGRDEQ